MGIKLKKEKIYWQSGLAEEGIEQGIAAAGRQRGGSTVGPLLALTFL